MGETVPNMKDIVQDEEEDDTRDSSSSSPSSTTDGFYSYNQNYTGSSFSSSSSSTTMLSTDLRLGLTLSSASSSRCVSKEMEEGADSSSLMIKVYMEGIPIGRKLDLMNQSGYHTLLPTLSLMFNTPLSCPGVNKKGISGRKHVLTYEDDDGDWMLVGDVPWEMFLRTVKKLRITKPQTC